MSENPMRGDECCMEDKIVVTVEKVLGAARLPWEGAECSMGLTKQGEKETPGRRTPKISWLSPFLAA